MIELVFSLFLFGLLHSWTATTAFKHQVRKRVGEKSFHRYYRLAYNVLSAITFVPSLFFARSSSAILWQMNGFGSVAFISIQVLAAVCVLLSLKQIDWREFIGVKQIAGTSNGNSHEPEPLVIAGFYKYVRHPLYLFSMIFIWCKPTMTVLWFIFSLGCSVYFIVGSYFEEVKLQRVYGSAYAEYKRRVFWFF